MTNERYRIMIVDDDEDLRALVRTALSQKFEVVEAVDGLDALNKLPDHQPDLAVIDFEMPLMSGLDLCAAIRRHNDFRGIPVLFLSAHGSKENMKKGYDAGADLFMTKPIEPSRMIKNIEFTIEHDKPPLRRKKYTIEVLRQMASGAGEAQDISEEVMGDPVLRNTTSPPPKPATVKRAPEPAAKPASPPAPEPARAPQPEAIRPMPEAKPVKSPEPKPAPAITPPAPGPMKLARQSQPAPAAGPQKARVMIVDNEEDARQLMELALRQNYEITTANDGLDAIEKIVSYQPDLLLIDVMMPRMNGFHLLQSLRRNPNFQHVPVLIVTARASQRDHDYAMKMGANDFVAKPFSTDDLIARVRALASAPDFRIVRKKLTIEEIVEKEYLRAGSRAADEESQKEKKRKYSELQDILDEQARRQH